MSNLLKDASILLTPTAYENGRMNAIKPYKDLYGPELVLNPNFEDSSWWGLDVSWSISNGSANCNGTGTIYKGGVVTIGKTYKVQVEISSYTSGTLSYPNASNYSIPSAIGVYTFYYVANSQTVSFTGSSFIGSIDNVSVVEDLSGDFQFSRNSAATRVNAQGLVENVQIISSELVSNGNFSQIGTEEVSNGNFSQEGSELVTNGDFSNGTTDWTPNASATLSIDTGRLKIAISGEASGYAKQDIFTIESGKQYKCTGTVDFGTASQMRFYVSNTGQFFDITQSGNFNFTFTSTGTSTQIRLYTYGDGNYGFWDNISVKEVGQDWSLGSGWSIGEDKAVATDVNNAFLEQSNILTIGKSYKITYTILDYVSGSVRFRANLVNGTTNGGNGTYTDYIVSAGTKFSLQGLSNFNGSITNISVKEVGQDWTFGTGWSIEDGKVYFDNPTGTELYQSLSTTASKYRISFDLDITSGTIQTSFSSPSTSTIESFTTSGTKTVDITTTASFSRFRFVGIGGSVFNIDNISVKEITDDTDLPRINYEGFSYQDSLGSEEIVNGDFSNGSANWGNYTSGSSTIVFTDVATLNVDASNSNVGIYQENVFASGKQYKVVLRIKASSSFDAEVLETQGAVTISTIGSVSLTTSYQDFTFYFTGTGTNDIFIHRKFSSPSANQSITIDNVSVKEVLGQEVVPDSGCGSWLLEPQSTNLITYSEDFSNSYWSKQATIVDANSIISADGTQNASKIQSTQTGSALVTVSYPALTVGNTYTFSCFAKKGNNDWIRLAHISSGGTGCWFDLENGVVGTVNSQSATIEDYGNGWYKCTNTFIAIGSTHANLVFIGICDADGSTNAGIVGQNDYLWGAQLEQQSYATSYIPTNGATNTRLQDIATNSGNSTLINSTEGVLYAEMAALADDGTNRIISLFEDGNINNRVNMFYTSGSNKMKFVVRINGSNVFDNTITLSNILNYNKVALKYKENDFGIYINGVKEVEQLSGSTYPSNTLDKLNFNQGSGSFPFHGKNKALAVYKKALTDANLRCLTYPNPVATTFDLDFDTIAEQFTFTRGSEATFVNEQGLIESTNQIGPELVTNGDFSNGNANWVFGGTNAPIVEDGLLKFSFSNGTYSRARQNIGIVNAKITYTVVNSNVSTFQIRDYGGASSQIVPATVGTHTIYRNFTGNGISFQSGGVDSGILEIDNVSVKEVISATNTPRIDYSTGAEAFLLEPQRTNRMPNSEDGSTWTLNNTTLSSLNGGLNKKYYQITSLGNTGRFDVVQNNWVNTTAGTYTASVFAKKGTCDEIILTTRANFGFQNYYSAFDLTNGLVTANASGVVGSIKPYGDGWYRCSITFTNTGGFTDSASLAFGFNFNSSSTDTLFVASPQSEIGSYATSYIPTSGASATRNQELCNNATPVINSEEGTLYAEFQGLSSSVGNKVISLNDGTNTNAFWLYIISSSNGIRIYDGATIGTYFSVNAFENNKFALVYNSTNTRLFINGSLAITIPFKSMSNLNKISFSDGNEGQKFEGNTKGLKYYPKALADVQLEDLTTI